MEYRTVDSPSGEGAQRMHSLNIEGYGSKECAACEGSVILALFLPGFQTVPVVALTDVATRQGGIRDRDGEAVGLGIVVFMFRVLSPYREWLRAVRDRGVIRGGRMDFGALSGPVRMEVCAVLKDEFALLQRLFRSRRRVVLLQRAGSGVPVSVVT